MMAAGIAHHFNNLLSLIMGYGEFPGSFLNQASKGQIEARIATRTVARPVLECETEAEMEGAEGLVLERARVDSVVETDRTDRQVVAQAGPDAVTQIAQSGRTGVGQQVSRIDEDRA